MARGKANNTRKVLKTPRKKDSPLVSPNKSESTASHDSFEMPNSPEQSECEKNGAYANNTDEFNQDFTGEMSKLLKRFNNDMSKTMQAKRRKLEQFTQESTRATTKKVLETNRNQSFERQQLIKHFETQFFAMIEQGESELDKIKEAEEKLQKLLMQEQKHQQQVRISHSQRIKALKKLSEEFCKGMNELEESHVEQYSSVHNELRQEMALLQKKILMETQQQEMMNVRKHLKQLFP